MEGAHRQRTALFNNLFRDWDGPVFAVQTSDGWSWRSSERPADCTLIVRTPKALHALLANPTDLTLGEAYIDGELDVEGDLFPAFYAAERVFRHLTTLDGKLMWMLRSSLAGLGQMLARGLPHSQRRDRSAISYHYDQPEEFYRPWLGDSMAYSCAYFRDPDECLDCAQRDKLELICRKLRLSPTDHFLDIGCGWGSLVLHAASEYGVDARGITISRSQADIAARRISQANLQENCAIEFRDYRRAPEMPLRFDKIASVGMFEHVGLKNLKQYFTVAYNMLKPGGEFLNHGIARSTPATRFRPNTFINKYVFPDGQLVSLSQALVIAESVGLEVRDVDNLREHYARTLRLWVEGLEQNRPAILKVVSERVYRIWRLYMAGCAVAFDRGDIAIYQVLFKRPERARNRPPMTREDFYRNWTPPAAKETRLVA